MTPQIRHLKSGLSNIQTYCAKFASIGSCEHFKTQVLYRIVDRLFTRHLPKTSEEFQQLLEAHRAEMDGLQKDILKRLSTLLDIYHRLQKQLKRPPLHWLDAMADIQDQLHHLLDQNFIVTTDEQHFSDLARYLSAIEKRLEKIQQNPDRDRKARLEISGLWDEYKKRSTLLEKSNRHSAQLEEYRWMLEEYRISLFAQEIKTRMPISAKRLRTAWNEITDA